MSAQPRVGPTVTRAAQGALFSSFPLAPALARSLATPSILNVGDSSSGQEDVQAHTLLAAFQLDRIAANLELALAYELVALRQARYLRAEPLPRALEVASCPSSNWSMRSTRTVHWPRTWSVSRTSSPRAGCFPTRRVGSRCWLTTEPPRPRAAALRVPARCCSGTRARNRAPGSGIAGRARRLDCLTSRK